MIGFIRGTVRDLDLGAALIEVGGVGYEVQISGAAHARLSALRRGEEGEIYTYLQVKEDQISLFGFADRTEKELFLKLTSVQGVGAKTALGILSALSPSDVGDAIANADNRRLSAVKGVGKKTADRIILELHGKIGADVLIAAEDSGMPKRQETGEESEAVSALMGLGFTRKESSAAVERARESGAKTLEEIISSALRGM